MPSRLRKNSWFYVSTMLIFLWYVPFGATAQQAPLPTAAVEIPIASATAVLIVLGLADSVNQDVVAAVDNELHAMDYQVVTLSDIRSSSFRWPRTGLVIAAGVAGCKETVEIVTQLPVRCVLLTEENFRHIESFHPYVKPQQLSALVIDQPVARQAQVANRVYPALSRFAVLTNEHTNTPSLTGITIDIQMYRPKVAMSAQLTTAISANDALIAIPEMDIFNRSSLRTVLLTAYGYGKPIIGLSRAYVKAGALITSYSTPTHVFKEVAESLVNTSLINRINKSSIDYPHYFSIANNRNVARSLGLSEFFTFQIDKTYIDEDFRQ